MAQKFSFAFEETFPVLLKGELQPKKNLCKISIRELDGPIGWSALSREEKYHVLLAFLVSGEIPVFTVCVSVSVAVPPNIAELKNLEVLNFFNNQIEELPTQISSLQKLKHLNLGWVAVTGARGEGGEREGRAAGAGAAYIPA